MKRYLTNNLSGIRTALVTVCESPGTVRPIAVLLPSRLEGGAR